MLSRTTATSRARERGTATHNATGGIPAPAKTTGRAVRRRRRRAGRATPVATRTQAVARMPLVTRKGGEYMGCRPDVGTARQERVGGPAAEGFGGPRRGPSH